MEQTLNTFKKFDLGLVEADDVFRFFSSNLNKQLIVQDILNNKIRYKVVMKPDTILFGDIRMFFTEQLKNVQELASNGLIGHCTNEEMLYRLDPSLFITYYLFIRSWNINKNYDTETIKLFNCLGTNTETSANYWNKINSEAKERLSDNMFSLKIILQMKRLFELHKSNKNLTGPIRQEKAILAFYVILRYCTLSVEKLREDN